jgi:hypothetical protein
MAKRYLFICVLLISTTQLRAQQYGLFNTRTLFDAFENPAQKAFVLDSSRQFASNFLLPYFGLNAANKGDSKYTLSELINNSTYNTDDILIGNNNRNKLFMSSNVYLLTFRMFQSYKYNKELGFSWQIRSDAFADYTNEALVVFGDYNRFTNSQNSLLNSNGFGQSYHQFSVTYRENLNKRLAFGAKLSLLSGITYNNIDITNSSLTINPATDDLTIGLTGTYKSNFLRGKEVNKNTFLPNFKNPGMSVSFGTSYTAKSGVFIMANIKDLGFIRWNKQSHAINVNSSVTVGRETIDPVDTNYINTNTLENELNDLFIRSDRQKSFYTPTNAKADFMISRKYEFYTPSLIISKNLFYQGGDAAFVNTFKLNEYSFSLSPTYNMNGFMMLGTQGMYQTPNFEFFLGTDNLLKSASIKQKATVNSGYTGASIYMGLGIKFGYIVEHPQNSSYMPGVGDDTQTGFFRRIFRVFQKKGRD